MYSATSFGFFRTRLVACALALGASFATPATADDYIDCQFHIQSCTHGIKSGRYKGKVLATLYLGRGALYLEAKKDDPRALADLTKAIAIHPGNVAFTIRGDYYKNTKNYGRAITDYSEAIRLDATDSLARNKRASVYLLSGSYDNAITDYTREVEIRLSGKNSPYTASLVSSALAQRGRVYFRQGDYKRALADYDDAIRYDDKNHLAFIRRGDTNFKMAKYSNAIADYNSAAKIQSVDKDYFASYDMDFRIHSNKAWPLYARGLAKQKAGDETGGNADIKAAKAMIPEIAGIVSQELGIQ